MKILIINQPSGNRGDESAHKALIRKLSDTYPNSIITTNFFGEDDSSVKPMELDFENLKYNNLKIYRGKQRLAKLSLEYRFLMNILLRFIPVYKNFDNMIRESDFVICAPGGICMGPFMNWDHILWLSRAIHHKKPIAYYSRSFGPFFDFNWHYKKFKKISLSLLTKFDFLSIRDKRTMLFADSIGLKYIPSIDTAFLETPSIDLPIKVSSILVGKYIVFVPNSLIWQPLFCNADKDLIMNFYMGIIEILKRKFEYFKIILLPQLFGNFDKDLDYFNEIKKNSKYESLIVLDDTYSSDIQQKIISEAQFVVGARYHSVVFAINNCTPFISLSYENKMFGLLSLLDLEDRQVDITNLGSDSFNVDNMLCKIEKIIDETSNYKMTANCIVAKTIANDCFEKLKSDFFTKC